MLVTPSPGGNTVSNDYSFHSVYRDKNKLGPQFTKLFLLSSCFKSSAASTPNSTPASNKRKHEDEDEEPKDDIR